MTALIFFERMRETMGIYAINNIGELIKDNTYVGRGIVIGKSADGKKAVTAYFIMGRSENSRNRVFIEQGDEIIIHPFDASKVEDPSLIIYAPVRQINNNLIVTNGDQTDTVYDFIKDGKTFFVINDFEKLRILFGELLAEIQRIKSEGDYEAGKAMVETYAVQVDPEIHKEVKDRYNALGIKPYGGFINPEIVPVVENGNTVDYRIEYPSDFLQQHIDYGKKYSTLSVIRQ